MSRVGEGRSPVALALGLSFVGGGSALIHQMVWIRRMVDTLGATADTFAAVTGAFFLGLAIGGWASTRLGSEVRGALWYRIAAAEILIGFLAVAVLLSPGMTPLLAGSVFPGGVLRVVLPLLLITPPAIAMGVVTPWLIRLCAQGQRPVAVPLYTVNTVGGLVGIVLSLAVLLPVFGTLIAGGAAIACNLIVGLVALAQGNEVKKKRSAGSDWKPQESELMPDARDMLVAFGSGFLVLAAEVILQLQLTQVTVNSHYSGGFVLILVLIGLSIGAALSGLWCRLFGDRTGIAIFWGLLAACVGFALQPLLFQLAFGGLKYQPYQIGLIRYFLQIIGPGFVCIVIPFLLAGLAFPLLLRRLQAGAPAATGLAFAFNGFGGWLGAEFAQGLVLPRLGLWGAACIVSFCYAVIAVIIGGSFGKKIWAAAGLMVGVGAWLAFSGLPQVQPTAQDKIRALGVGREGVVAVSEGEADDWRIIFNNSYTLGGSRASTNQERQAHLPILLHGRATRVATLGVATGSTASGALCHPGVTRLDAIELSPLVLKYAAKYFSPFNRQFFSDPRVHLIQADARWEILSHPDTYDVIVGDLFLPWRTGEGRLYSLEHFRSVQRALRTGGVFCQWLPMYQLTQRQFLSIAQTFQRVFPDVFLLRGDFYADKPIVGLVGGRKLSDLDWESIERSCSELREHGGVSDPLVRHSEGVAMMVAGPLPSFDPASVITLDNGWIEWNAGRNILSGREPWFSGVPMARFLKLSHEMKKDMLPDRLVASGEAGQFFATLAIAQATKIHHVELTQRMYEFLPGSLATDKEADWKRWPGSPKPFSP